MIIGKKSEQDIKTVKSFLEFWGKFHSIYANIISKELITQDDEAKFLETKELIRMKYDEMKKGMDLHYVPRTRPTDPVSDILALNGVRFMAEKNLSKVDDDWKDSYVFLNSILERLKGNKRRLEQFNPVGVFFKRMFRNK
jgi:hypothetical protein